LKGYVARICSFTSIWTLRSTLERSNKLQQAMIASETIPEAALVTPIPSKNVVRFMDTLETSFSSNVNEIFRCSKNTTRSTKEPTEAQCAALLLSVAGIVSKEIDSEGVDWDDDMADPPPLSLVDTENLFSRHAKNPMDSEPLTRPRPSITSMQLLNRIRAVSIDMCDADPCGEDASQELSCSSSASSEDGPVVVSPLNSPVSRRNPRRATKIKALLLNKRSEMPTKKSVEAKGTLNGPVKTILRKKFSWKNYPEVSAKILDPVLLCLLLPNKVSLLYFYSWKLF
jgi:hypothetical protein